jgi:cell division septation protein DedD
VGRFARALATAAMVIAVAVPAAAIPPPGAPACRVFPSNNVWHADISKLPVNARSSAWLSSMSASSANLHPDFGPSGGFPYGIPYDVVPSSHPKISLTFDYTNESDKGPYPFDDKTQIEGGPNAGGDRHAIMIDSGTCTLYELYNARYSTRHAGSGAIWKLTSNALRPATWTSADAAGLPIFAGLVRLDEVKAGNVDHAIRVTAQQTDTSFIWPARHQAGSASNHNLPPMGARFRLKASYDISHFRSDTQTILRAMKKYGLIVADNGSNWFFQGTAENGWNTTMLDQLKSVPARMFEAVDESSLMVSSSSGAVKSSAHSSTPVPTAKTTPKATSTPKPTPSKSPTNKPSPSPSVTNSAPSPSASPTRVITALGKPETGSKTSIQLWLITGAIAASILVLLVLFLRARAAQKSNLPSK